MLIYARGPSQAAQWFPYTFGRQRAALIRYGGARRSPAPRPLACAFSLRMTSACATTLYTVLPATTQRLLSDYSVSGTQPPERTCRCPPWSYNVRLVRQNPPTSTIGATRAHPRLPAPCACSHSCAGTPE